MIPVGSFDRNGLNEEGRFLTIVVISIAAHVVLLFSVGVFSGFTSPARVSAVPDYTPVRVVSVRDIAGPRPKEVHISKARKQITTKSPTLVQEKIDIKRLKAAKMAVEKKGLTPEKIAPKKEEPPSSAAKTSAGDAARNTPAPTARSSSQDSFAVHGVGAASGMQDIPEITVYTSIVIDRIMEAWFLPPSLKREALQKSLVIVVSIRIDQEGVVTLQGIEKSSGNNLFDNYALSAIKKVQSESFPPLPDVYRRPYLDLGIRFHPSEIGS